MLGNLDHVMLFVNDLNRATAFYRDVLGMRVVMESPHFVGVQAGEMMIGLHPTEKTGAGVGPGAIPYFAVGDVSTVVEELRRRGVHIHREPTRPGGGPLIARFHDSEGNTLGLIQR